MTPPRNLRLWVLLVTASTLATAADAGRTLRVCADPDSLPFSNDRLEGFENKVAQVIADDLHAALRYVWSPQSRGSIGQALSGGKCDLVIGAPAGWGPVLTTKPYYASTYVFVYSKNKHLSLSSFDNPELRNLKIGLPLISGGGANPPPAYALARRGLASNVVGFPMFPPGKIIEAVAAGEIDVAVVWGPPGGYFAKRQPVELAVTPVRADNDDPSLRFTFEISLGVKRGDTALKDELEGVLDRKHNEILKVLEDNGVPVTSFSAGGSTPAESIH
jgi:quinoprotein dehydrogenase-associated probable ABC transporter substrate-binding protein